MKNEKTNHEVEISFPKRLNGYDRNEVDRYIADLSEAYQTAYKEHAYVSAKYDSLLEEYKTLDGEREQTYEKITQVVSEMLSLLTPHPWDVQAK